ncbi:COG3 [Branchiostoma lanceolatum]|uniref:Conserved oligomeric Golgi complex subunit 3 n=1 Tax=Branchiostoma lanceolatum TaxID=7740 RepID=A0A8J9ZP26_BRALA|nr:COG3 [Branchiostoma lanceolatum]
MPDFAECDVHLARFRQCLSKALNLIKTYMVNLLQQASQQVQPKGNCKDAQGPSDNAFTLYYGKFRTNAPRVKLLMEQIEERIDRSPEYQQLLNDCHQCYFNQRQLLLGPSVTTAVTEMAGHHVRDNSDELRAFETVALQMLEDVQERLVYRAHIYIQTDIQSYNPAPGDLAYPDKLEMMETTETIPAPALPVKRSRSINMLMPAWLPNPTEEEKEDSEAFHM